MIRWFIGLIVLALKMIAGVMPRIKVMRMNVKVNVKGETLFVARESIASHSARRLAKALLLAVMLAISFAGRSGGQAIPQEQDIRNKIRIDARTYGVKANGVTDDYAAMQKAVTATPTGGILQLPRGTIYMSQKFTLTRGDIEIVGAGPYDTILKTDLTVGNNSYILKFSGPGAGSPIKNIVLHDFSVDASSFVDGVDRINTGTATATTSTSITLGSAASATTNFYQNCWVVITADSGTPSAVGQVAAISAYNGGTKVATVPTWPVTPSANAKYGILLVNNTTAHTSNGDDQITRGCGRIGFYDCENVKIYNLRSFGGFGWIDFRRVDRVAIHDLSCASVIENAVNFLGGTDSSSVENCEYISVVNCIFQSGEGIDASCDFFAFIGIVWEAIGYGDECIDGNSSHYGVIADITAIGGTHGVNFHGNPTAYDTYNASYFVTVMNVSGLNQLASTVSFYYGVPANSTYMLSLGNPSAGTFSLTKGGNSATGIQYNVSAATLQSTIEGITGMGAGSVIVTGNPGGPYKIAFKPGKEGALTGSGAGLTGGTFAITDISQRASNGLCHDITITGVTSTSNVAGSKGLELSWTSTSLPCRIDNVTVSQCVINTPSRCIDAPYSKNLTIDNVIGTSTGAEAININHATYFSEDVTIQNCRLTGVGASTTQGGAIFLGGTYRPTIRNNVCSTLIQGYGINLKNCQAPKVIDNDILTAAHHGLVVEWTSTTQIAPDNDLRAEIRGNEIYQFGVSSNGRFGISCTTSSAATGQYTGLNIKNNYINYTTTYDVTTGGASAGTFTLTWNGVTTPAIPYNTTAANLQMTLEAMTGIGPGKVAVYGNTGGPWYIDFLDTLDNTANAITGSGAGLTGGAFAVNTHNASKAYNVTATTAGYLTGSLTGNECTDIFTATNKATLTGFSDNSSLSPNKFGSTFAGGTMFSLDGWYQEDVPATQSALEANYGSKYLVVTGTAQAGAASTITLAAGASATDSIYNGWLVGTTGGTGPNQTRVITGYVGSTKVATVSPNWGTNPDATTTYFLYRPKVEKELIGAKRWVANKSGSIVRVWAKSNTNVTAGTLTITVYKNGLTTAFACTIAVGSSTGFAIQPSGMDTFVQGDALSIYVTTDGSFTPTTLDLVAGFDVEE